ncbi:MAG TPA: hypothetical protein VHM19_21975 [Polyangiales bacterium]|jgi:hypothetical protein|nr:hypothetical protein [Polyangiales bacterium]
MNATDNAGAPVAMCAEHPGRAAVGTCERCGGFFCDACAGRLQDGKKFCKSCDARQSYIAWEDLSLPIWRRYLETVRASLVELPKLAAELPTTGGFAAPLSYALLPTALGALIGSALGALFIGTMMRAPFMASGQTDSHVWSIATGGVFVAYLLSSLLGFALYVGVWAGVLTGSAQLFGAGRLRYEGMFRIVCYASGLNLLSIIPMVGAVLVFVYHLIVVVSCIAAQGRVSGLTGLAIVGVPAFGFALFCCGGYVFFLMSVLGHGH